MPRQRSRCVAFCALCALACTALRAQENVRVYAAASLTNALTDVGAAWEREGHVRPTLVFAASSTLAKQIEAGAPADLYLAADRQWMDYLQARRKLEPDTRVNLVGNTLVLIVPKGQRFPVRMQPDFAIERAFGTRLCMAETATVPAGIYGRQALQALGWWPRLQHRVVGTDDVRTALAFVERGECALGIVYATDAAISARVEVLASFPADTHDAIVYPAALIAGARTQARPLLDYLAHAPAAQAAFTRYGFERLAH
jgi:molybdate transport system substrate-binding protein